MKKTTITNNTNENRKTAYFHLPGLFEFYELYEHFLPIFRKHREYFYDWCEIGSIYGAPADCIWGGGRIENGDVEPEKVLELLGEYGISARLTFSNSLLKEEHLQDKKCNEICRLFAEKRDMAEGNISNRSRDIPDENRDNPDETRDTPNGNSNILNGVIVHSELLLDYLKRKYPELYLVSSTTKVLTDFNELKNELNREEFKYVVPDFRLNREFDKLAGLSQPEKDKVEFLCNECCYFECRDRKKCYEAVSWKNLGGQEEYMNHSCKAPYKSQGYRFSKSMENPGFIGIEDIKNNYLPMGFSNFKIEGRSLGSALILEFLLYYLTKPQYHIHVREEIYLDNMLDIY